jgi:hypothetical protein
VTSVVWDRATQALRAGTDATWAPPMGEGSGEGASRSCRRSRPSPPAFTVADNPRLGELKRPGRRPLAYSPRAESPRAGPERDRLAATCPAHLARPRRASRHGRSTYASTLGAPPFPARPGGARCAPRCVDGPTSPPVLQPPGQALFDACAVRKPVRDQVAARRPESAAPASPSYCRVLVQRRDGAELGVEPRYVAPGLAVHLFECCRH